MAAGSTVLKIFYQLRYIVTLVNGPSQIEGSGKFLPMPSGVYPFIIYFLRELLSGFSANAMKNLKTPALPERYVKQAVTTLKLPAHWQGEST